MYCSCAVDKRCPPAFRELIERCCAFKPEARPTIDEVVSALEAIDVSAAEAEAAESKVETEVEAADARAEAEGADEQLKGYHANDKDTAAPPG